MTAQDRKLTVRERVWQVVWWLARGERLTPGEIHRQIQLAPRGARKLMMRMSLVLPIYKKGGKWQALEDEEE